MTGSAGRGEAQVKGNSSGKPGTRRERRQEAAANRQLQVYWESVLSAAAASSSSSSSGAYENGYSLAAEDAALET